MKTFFDLEQRSDGSWVPSVPEPLWVGWRLRTAQCICGEKFKRCRCPFNDDYHAHTALERYQEHFERIHL